jgi:hypothetical protein
MKKLFMLALIFALALVMGISTASAWFVSIEPIGTADIANGDTLTAEVYFNVDAGESVVLDGYEFALGYDTAELSFASLTSTPPSPLSALFGAPYDSGGIVDNFHGVTFAVGPTLTEGSTLLATVDFTVLAPILDGELDVWFADSPHGADQFKVDGGIFNMLVPNADYVAQGPDVGAVPVPAAVWLLGSGLLGLIGIRRRNA